MKKILLMLMALLCFTAFATASVQYEPMTAPVEIRLCQSQSFCQQTAIASEVILFERQVNVELYSPQNKRLAMFDPDVLFRLCETVTSPFISTELSDICNCANALFRHRALREQDYIDVKAPVFWLNKHSTHRGGAQVQKHN